MRRIQRLGCGVRNILLTIIIVCFLGKAGMWDTNVGGRSNRSKKNFHYNSFPPSLLAILPAYQRTRSQSGNEEKNITPATTLQPVTAADISLERRTRDWKVVGSNPCWSGGRIFFSRVDLLCWLLFRYPFHPRVTAVARKRSRSFCQKCRWQVTAKHAYTLRMWLCMKWHGA